MRGRAAYHPLFSEDFIAPLRLHRVRRWVSHHGVGQRPLDAAIEFECPHCWQVHHSQVDLTLGDQQWIEDCQHCCGAILVNAAVVDDGRGVQVDAGRADG